MIMPLTKEKQVAKATGNRRRKSKKKGRGPKPVIAIKAIKESPELKDSVILIGGSELQVTLDKRTVEQPKQDLVKRDASNKATCPDSQQNGTIILADNPVVAIDVAVCEVKKLEKSHRANTSKPLAPTNFNPNTKNEIARPNARGSSSQAKKDDSKKAQVTDVNAKSNVAKEMRLEKMEQRTNKTRVDLSDVNPSPALPDTQVIAKNSEGTAQISQEQTVASRKRKRRRHKEIAVSITINPSNTSVLSNTHQGKSNIDKAPHSLPEQQSNPIVAGKHHEQHEALPLQNNQEKSSAIGNNNKDLSRKNRSGCSNTKSRWLYKNSHMSRALASAKLHIDSPTTLSASYHPSPAEPTQISKSTNHPMEQIPIPTDLNAKPTGGSTTTRGVDTGTMEHAHVLQSTSSRGNRQGNLDSRDTGPYQNPTTRSNRGLVHLANRRRNRPRTSNELSVTMKDTKKPGPQVQFVTMDASRPEFDLVPLSYATRNGATSEHHSTKKSTSATVNSLKSLESHETSQTTTTLVISKTHDSRKESSKMSGKNSVTQQQLHFKENEKSRALGANQSVANKTISQPKHDDMARFVPPHLRGRKIDGKLASPGVPVDMTVAPHLQGLKVNDKPASPRLPEDTTLAPHLRGLKVNDKPAPPRLPEDTTVAPHLRGLKVNDKPASPRLSEATTLAPHLRGLKMSDKSASRLQEDKAVAPHLQGLKVDDKSTSSQVQEDKAVAPHPCPPNNINQSLSPQLQQSLVQQDHPSGTTKSQEKTLSSQSQGTTMSQKDLNPTLTQAQAQAEHEKTVLSPAHAAEVKGMSSSSHPKSSTKSEVITVPPHMRKPSSLKQQVIRPIESAVPRRIKVVSTAHIPKVKGFATAIVHEEASVPSQLVGTPRDVSSVAMPVTGNIEAAVAPGTNEVLQEQQPASVKDNEVSAPALIGNDAQPAKTEEPVVVAGDDLKHQPDNSVPQPLPPVETLAQEFAIDEDHPARDPESTFVAEVGLAKASKADTGAEAVCDDGEIRPKKCLEYEPCLVDWNGNWMPAPVEWDGRPSFNNNDGRHVAFMEAWMNHRVYEALNYPFKLDVTDPNFSSGEGPASGLIRPWQPYPVDWEIKLPDDPFTHARIEQTAEKSARAFCKKHYAEKKVRKEERQAYKEIARQMREDYVPPPNPHIPKANIYIRPAQFADALQISRIYNHYVKNSFIACEEEETTEDEWRQRWRDGGAEALPFLVAVLRGSHKGTYTPVINNETVDHDTGRGFGHWRGRGRGRGRGNRRNNMYTRGGQPPQEIILGFAYAEDFSSKRDAFKYTAELQFYVHPAHLHLGIGKTLVDRIMPALDKGYISRAGTEFLAENEGNYDVGGRREIRRIIVNIGYHTKEDTEFLWRKEWLAKSWNFEHVGTLPAVGFKFNEPYNLAMLVKETWMVLGASSKAWDDWVAANMH